MNDIYLFFRVDEDTGEKSTVIVGRHGCESDLSHIGEETVLCSEHTDACVNIDHASLPDHNDNNVTVTDIEICFCSGDRLYIEEKLDIHIYYEIFRCNTEDPIPPEPTQPGAASTVISSIVLLLLSLLL